MKKEYDFSKMKRAAKQIQDTKGAKVMKTLRLDLEVLTWAADEADKRGIGYQTFINLALRKLMNPKESSVNPLREEIREIVREELKKTGS